MLKALLLGGALLLAIALPAAAQDIRVNRIRASPGPAARHLKTKVEPIYPETARKKHVEGEVVLHIITDKQGNVRDINAVSGPSLLRPAAIAAVKQWKYDPTILNGYPVEVDTRVTVEFSLKKK